MLTLSMINRSCLQPCHATVANVDTATVILGSCIDGDAPHRLQCRRRTRMLHISTLKAPAAEDVNMSSQLLVAMKGAETVVETSSICARPDKERSLGPQKRVIVIPNRVKLQCVLHLSRIALFRLRSTHSMPRQKRSKNEYDEGDGFVEAEGSKKKVKSAEKVVEKPDGHVDEDGNQYWEVGHALELVY